MPSISKKGKSMPESPIRKLIPYAEQAKRNGISIFHLNIGQPDIETPKVMLDAVRNNNLRVVEYSHSAGIESYRRKLAGYYGTFNIDVDYTDIIVTTGGSEAIEITMMSCLDEGDEVIIPEPFYANYIGFAVQAGIKIKPIVSTIEDGFALPGISEFEKLIGPKTKAIMICNPSNPTGYLYSRDELSALRDIVKKHNLYLFSDEVYREFCYDSKEYISVMHLKGIEQNVVLLDSVSKRYSACGVRIGAIVSKNKEVMNTALKFAQARLSPPTFGQIAAAAAIDTPPSYFTKVREEYVARRDFLVTALNSIDGVICPKPSGAFYVIAQLPVDDTDKFCQWMLEHFSYKKQTVMMAPASGFYSSPGLGKNQVRVAYVLNLESLKLAMECLTEGLKKYPGKIVGSEKIESGSSIN
jgi:aspartate aminotransferase